jgi:hypothetical protein
LRKALKLFYLRADTPLGEDTGREREIAWIHGFPANAANMPPRFSKERVRLVQHRL